jgi:acetyl/propionyl-CoA carboxylase alpha subunit
LIYHVTIGGRTLAVELDGHTVTVDGASFGVALARVEGGPVRSLLVDESSHRFVAHRSGDGRWDVHLRGRRIRAEVVDERTREIRAMTGQRATALGPRPVIAPMPGMIVRVEVVEGDVVAPGQGVVIVEAMKMENELAAEAAGVVRRVHVTAGQAVEKDQLLVDLAALPEEGE